MPAEPEWVPIGTAGANVSPPDAESTPGLAGGPTGGLCEKIRGSGWKEDWALPRP